MLAETENQSMRTDLEVLSSFDFIITTSTMQRDVGSMSVSVNRNGHRGAVFVFQSFDDYVTSVGTYMFPLVCAMLAE